MSNFLGRLISKHRTISPPLHRLFHGGDHWWDHRYAEHGCWMCRAVTGEIREYMEPFQDLSSLAVSEPVYDADGNLIERGVSMSATAKRQLDAIMAGDPETAAIIQAAIDDIRKNPGPE